MKREIRRLYNRNLYSTQGRMWIGGTAWQWTMLCTVGAVFKQDLTEESEGADWRWGSR